MTSGVKANAGAAYLVFRAGGDWDPPEQWLPGGAANSDLTGSRGRHLGRHGRDRDRRPRRGGGPRRRRRLPSAKIGKYWASGIDATQRRETGDRRLLRERGRHFGRHDRRRGAGPRHRRPGRLGRGVRLPADSDDHEALADLSPPRSDRHHHRPRFRSQARPQLREVRVGQVHDVPLLEQHAHQVSGAGDHRARVATRARGAQDRHEQQQELRGEALGRSVDATVVSPLSSFG